MRLGFAIVVQSREHQEPFFGFMEAVLSEVGAESPVDVGGSRIASFLLHFSEENQYRLLDNAARLLQTVEVGSAAGVGVRPELLLALNHTVASNPHPAPSNW